MHNVMCESYTCGSRSHVTTSIQVNPAEKFTVLLPKLIHFWEIFKPMQKRNILATYWYSSQNFLIFKVKVKIFQI